MHQDQRVGLALGVLLLGAAGAFFFRNDTKSGTETPRLRSAKQLDARIAEKSVAPYLQGIEDVDSPLGTPARNVSDRGGPLLSQDSDGALPRLDAPDFLLDDTVEPFGSATNRARSRYQNETADDGVPELVPIPIPDTDEVVARGTASPEEAASAPTEFDRVHIVQKGETLSSIAAKELGGTNRFLDIFEANRDQLKDANDVRIGMQLKIPSRRAIPGTKSSSPNSKKDLLSNSAPPLLEPRGIPRDVDELPPITIGSEADAKRGSDAATASPAAQPSSPGKKFVPAKRAPLGTRLAPQTDASDPRGQAGRRLSQLPPEDAGGKVAR